MLLDEPTNHLDVDGIETLEELLQRNVTCIVITHDRTFFDFVNAKNRDLRIIDDRSGENSSRNPKARDRDCASFQIFESDTVFPRGFTQARNFLRDFRYRFLISILQRRQSIHPVSQLQSQCYKNASEYFPFFIQVEFGNGYFLT